MKKLFTQLFWPILRFFETGEDAPGYKQSHRVTLLVVGSLFIILSAASGFSAGYSDDLGALIPVVVFLCIGLVAVVVGWLGSNAAVSKIWGTKQPKDKQ